MSFSIFFTHAYHLTQQLLEDLNEQQQLDCDTKPIV